MRASTSFSETAKNLYPPEQYRPIDRRTPEERVPLGLKTKDFILDESYNRWYSRTEFQSVNDHVWFSTKFEGLGKNGIYYKKCSRNDDDPPDFDTFRRCGWAEIPPPVEPMNPEQPAVKKNMNIRLANDPLR